MKKIYAFLLASAVGLSAMAQVAGPLATKYTEKPTQIENAGLSMQGIMFDSVSPRVILGLTEGDPIFPIFDPSNLAKDIAIMKPEFGGGYWFGTNGFYKVDSTTIGYPVDLWSQTYLNDNAVNIVGAIVLFDDIQYVSKDTNSNVGLYLSQTRPDGTLIVISETTTANIIGPNLKKFVDSARIKLQDLRARDADSIPIFNAFMFNKSNYIEANAGLSLTIDFAQARLHGDTCYLIATAGGTGRGQHYASYAQQYWSVELSRKRRYNFPIDRINTPENNAFDCNLSMFPIIDTTYNGINSNVFYQGMKLSINPNPVKEVANVQYAIENNGVVSMDIIDATGRVVKSVNVGAKPEGKHSQEIDVRDLKAGNYFFSLNNKGQRLVKQMVIE